MNKDLEQLVEILDSKKGKNIHVIDVSEMTPITNYVIIVTVNSNVHATSLSGYVIDFFKEKKLNHYIKHKITSGESPWILIDGETYLVNLFTKEAREFYNLEKIYFSGKVVDFTGAKV